MKVYLKYDSEGDETELETQSITLGDFLAELSKKYPNSRFFHRNRWEVGFEYFVELNGQMHDTLPQELDTKLKNGDKVEIYVGNEFLDD